MDEGERIVRRWDTLDTERATIKNLVQEVMDYCLPARATITRKRIEGSHPAVRLYDSTAERACERFATGLYDFMCPPGRSWFLLTPPIEHGPLAGDLARPLLALSKTLRDEIARSNFAEAIHELFLDLGSAGTGTLQPQEGTDSLLQFTAYPFEQVVFCENAAGRVDTVYRKFAWTARQCVQEFGLANVGTSIAEAYSEREGANRDKEFEIVHAALPRTEYAGGQRDVLNMPVASTWVAVKDKQVLRRSGWPEMRYLVVRLSKVAGERHGRSPGRTALPDIKMVNDIEYTIIQGAEMAVGPPAIAPENSIIGPRDAEGKIQVRPGSLISYRPNPLHPGLKPEPWRSGSDVRLGHEYAETKRGIIEEAFYNDLFLILSDEKRRTATEVREILAEKLNLLGPQFGRMKVELFDPKIRIAIAILENAGLAGGLGALLDLANIRYTSTLALAMEYAELTAMQDAMIFLSPFSEIDPTIWDNFSFDEISRGIAEKMCLPPEWLRPRDEVRALRDRRMQYQAAQLQQQLAGEQLDRLGKLGGPVDPTSVLARAEAA